VFFAKTQQQKNGEKNQNVFLILFYNVDSGGAVGWPVVSICKCLCIVAQARTLRVSGYLG